MNSALATRTTNWCDLLAQKDSLKALAVEDLEALNSAGNDYLHSIAHGISGIGNLLACTASNSETGLDKEAVTNIGWMLESLGSLISNLSDVMAETEYLANEHKSTNKRKGAAK